MDGGSDDGTRAFLEQLAAEDDSIRILDHLSRRVPNPLNIGLRETRGEFVARMDAHTLLSARVPFHGHRPIATGRRRLGKRSSDRRRRGCVVEVGCACAQSLAGRGEAKFRYPLDQGDRGRHRLHRRLAAVDARGGRRLGRGVGRESRFRARRPGAPARRPDRLRPRNGRPLRSSQGAITLAAGRPSAPAG